MSERLVFELQAIDRATAPLKAVQAQINATSNVIDVASNKMNRFGTATTAIDRATQRWAKGALQQAGFQVGDFAVQLANGTNGLQAFGQQAPQLLQIFGPAGAVIGAVVAVVAALGVVAQKSGGEIENLGSALGVLQAPLSAITDSVKAAGSALGSVFGSLSGEIDTAIIAAGLFAGVMAVRAVPALIAASGASAMFSAAMVTFRAAIVASAISTGTFSGVMTMLRATALTVGAAFSALGTIMMRFLPVAVLLGMAKLIEIFLRLKEGAGGFGEAMKLLGDLVKAVWQGMVDSAKSVVPALNGVWLSIKSGFMDMVSDIIWAWSGMLNSMGNAIEGLMPDVAAKMHAAATGAMTASNEWMLSATDASNKASEAFGAAGDKMSSAWDGVGTAWGALKDAVAAGTQEVDIFGDAAVEASDKAGGAADAITEKLTQQQENMKAIATTIMDSFSGAFMSMVDGTKSVKDAFKDMARSIISKLYEVMVVQRIVNGIMGFVGKAFPALAPGIAAMDAAWNGGGITGNKPVLVGEKGPELVVPSRNAQVIPNNQLGGNGVTVVQHNTFGSGVKREEIQAMLPKIVEATKAAVFDAQRRSVNGMGY